MNDVYQAALLAHAKNPYGAGAVPRGTEDAEALNSGCGDEIRGQWTELETNLSSSFVLYRVKPAEPRATAPAALSTQPARPAQARPGFAANPAPDNGTREDVDDLPNGVRVDRVPDPGLN